MIRKMKITTQYTQAFQSNQRIFVHGATATPFKLIEGLMEQAPRLKNVELIHLHTLGNAPYADSKYDGIFKVSNLFVGSNVRKQLDYDRVDYLPCFLSEIPELFRSGQVKLSIALIHVSPPDAHGFCSLGTSVDIVKAAVDTAEVVIAQINPQMPRVHGDGFVHTSQIDFAIEVNEPIPEVLASPLTEIEKKIGQFTAELIEDKATLQMGIGAIPDAVLYNLKGHRNLGIHSEMWSDGALELILCGAVDNSFKAVHRGKTVSGFVSGSRRLYEFIHDNPSVIQLQMDYVNNPITIARNPKVAAINSALEIDLTGQICADSIGSKIFSGVGGQMDFMRGAALSKGGKPIIALISRTHKGESKIVPALKVGAGVVTTRAHAHYVVTEYGVTNLHGKTLKERAQQLILIAHPEDREALDRSWHQIFKKSI